MVQWLKLCASTAGGMGFDPDQETEILHAAAAAAAKSLQSCPTLFDPIAGSPPGSPVPEILQARTLEWAAIYFSNAWKWKVKVKSLSRVWLLATSWIAAHQAPPSMGFSRQEYQSGLPLPSPLHAAVCGKSIWQKQIFSIKFRCHLFPNPPWPWPWDLLCAPTELLKCL